MRSESLSLEEAVEFLGTSRPTFYRWLQEGKVKGARLGRKWSFQKHELQALLQPGDDALIRQLIQAAEHYRSLKGRA